MASLSLLAMPAQGVGYIGDHVYLSSDMGLTWRCNGRTSGGTLVRGATAADIDHCLCLALPDQGPQAGLASLGDMNAGIIVGITGVCHQIANRILRPCKLDVSRVNGYAFTLTIYGKWGRRPWVEWSRCGSRVTGPSSTMPGGSTGRARRRDLSFIFMTDPQAQSRSWMDIMNGRGSENGDTLEEAYERFGYEAPEARRAEIEGLLEEQLGRAVDDEEKARIVEEHQRFHAQQDRILARLAEDALSPEPGMATLTEARVRFFSRCDAILGHERFVRLFGGDLATATEELEALKATSGR